MKTKEEVIEAIEKLQKQNESLKKTLSGLLKKKEVDKVDDEDTEDWWEKDEK